MWDFGYGDWKIEKPEKGVPLASGSAVHETIQARLKGEIGEDEMVGYAYDSLFRTLAWRNDVESQVKKFGPGVERSLNWVPNWVWERTDWKVEEQLYVELDDEVALNFTPDLYGLTAEYVDGVNGPPVEVIWLDIVDFKTGKKDALDYYLHNPQLMYYAVALQKLYAHLDPLIRITYVSLPTGERDNPVPVEPWILSTDQLEEAERELMEGIREVGEKARWANRNTHCGFCDYGRICQTRMLMGDWRGVIRDEYVSKELRYTGGY